MRNVVFRWGVAVAALYGLTCCATAGGTIATTRYDYYTISGASAVEVYDAMLKRGPHVDGDKAYAATSATTSQQGKLLSGKSCKVQDYAVKIEFVIRLPKLAATVKLGASERQRFQQFAAFLKKHEETHRSIWLDCAAKLEARASRLSAPTCDEVDAQSTKLWQQMRQSCNLRHQAFDAAEQKRVLQQPFIRYVLNRSYSSTAGAKAP